MAQQKPTAADLLAQARKDYGTPKERAERRAEIRQRLTEARWNASDAARAQGWTA